MASEFQHFEQAESGKNKQPKLDVISDFKKFSESTQTKLEKVILSIFILVSLFYFSLKVNYPYSDSLFF